MCVFVFGFIVVASVVVIPLEKYCWFLISVTIPYYIFCYYRLTDIAISACECEKKLLIDWEKNGLIQWKETNRSKYVEFFFCYYRLADIVSEREILVVEITWFVSMRQAITPSEYQSTEWSYVIMAPVLSARNISGAVVHNMHFSPQQHKNPIGVEGSSWMKIKGKRTNFNITLLLLT